MEIKNVNVARSPAAKQVKSTNDFSLLMNSYISAFIHAVACSSVSSTATHTHLSLAFFASSCLFVVRQKKVIKGHGYFAFPCSDHCSDPQI